ncbi:hypothetical protein F3Y22_tig00110570pilonHSYRG00170 [Hibiscus syriacus]|uniref:Uncharacterized protein n=1 Tax=Hibiscus syriacus TaxID=106335 RepID=A0A6A3A745_HIBSY|nr:hypothetical protein F3Y22_tig00110570pilonHSYRG00170 [Hibiscus syriacus]
MDLQKIDQRVDRLEYSGVMELVSDVQLVRSEGRKVLDMFFDLLKIAFPDTDFREARNALAFSGLVSTSASSLSARHCKRPKLINELESDSNLTQKTLQRGSTHAGEDTRVKEHMPPMESRLGKGIREQYQHNGDSILTHPGELVICKKKRKEREKSTVKHRSGSVGPVSPRNNGRNIRSPGAGSVSKDARPTQQTNHMQGFLNQPGHLSNCSSGIVGWANPVKKMRTVVEFIIRRVWSRATVNSPVSCSMHSKCGTPLISTVYFKRQLSSSSIFSRETTQLRALRPKLNPSHSSSTLSNTASALHLESTGIYSHALKISAKMALSLNMKIYKEKW